MSPKRDRAKIFNSHSRFPEENSTQESNSWHIFVFIFLLGGGNSWLSKRGEGETKHDFDLIGKLTNNMWTPQCVYRSGNELWWYLLCLRKNVSVREEEEHWYQETSEKNWQVFCRCLPEELRSKKHFSMISSMMKNLLITSVAFLLVCAPFGFGLQINLKVFSLKLSDWLSNTSMFDHFPDFTPVKN